MSFTNAKNAASDFRTRIFRIFRIFRSFRGSYFVQLQPSIALEERIEMVDIAEDNLAPKFGASSETVRPETPKIEKLDEVPGTLRGLVRVSDRSSAVGMNESANSLGEVLLHDTRFTDISIEVRGRLIRAHKCVLAGRSNVLAKELTMETSSYKMDCEFEVAHALITFLYVGKVSIASVLVQDLRRCAQQFDVASLITSCNRILLQQYARARESRSNTH